MLACLRASSKSGAGGVALRVYNALLIFIDADAGCYPSQRTLADMTGMDRRSVRRGLRELEELGLLRITPRQGEDGGRRSDHYSLIPGRADAPGMAQTVGTPRRPGVGAIGGHTDAPGRGETKNRTDSINPEEDVSDDVGRCAPSCYPSGEAAPPEPPPGTAYTAAVKAAKRRNWLRSLHKWAGQNLTEAALWRFWEAGDAAQRAGSREATPVADRQMLDEVDRRRRARGQK
ncbi:MAG TPA: helix-turn-helix domain-containing protein [Caulobacteraceae bacterium]|jgi:DNA-binding transcriptional MocR family regulator|nr:helix-turn-helix domain-containing protein [Caulobacteraceae bacterium]